MPYIKQEDRDSAFPPRNAGELNYVITLHLVRYLQDKGLSYQTLNDIMGALGGAKLEFYRRVVVPYEKTKISENGDVY